MCMMTQKECVNAWNKVIECYDKTCENGPKATVMAAVDELGMEKTQEVFATIAKIKQRDGRISDINKKAMENIPVNQDNCKRGHDNLMISAKLDYIHPARIDQMLTEKGNYLTKLTKCITI